MNLKKIICALYITGKGISGKYFTLSGGKNLSAGGILYRRPKKYCSDQGFGGQTEIGTRLEVFKIWRIGSNVSGHSKCGGLEYNLRCFKRPDYISGNQMLDYWHKLTLITVFR